MQRPGEGRAGGMTVTCLSDPTWPVFLLRGQESKQRWWQPPWPAGTSSHPSSLLRDVFAHLPPLSELGVGSRESAVETQINSTVSMERCSQMSPACNLPRPLALSPDCRLRRRVVVDVFCPSDE